MNPEIVEMIDCYIKFLNKKYEKEDGRICYASVSGVLGSCLQWALSDEGDRKIIKEMIEKEVSDCGVQQELMLW